MGAQEPLTRGKNLVQLVGQKRKNTQDAPLPIIVRGNDSKQLENILMNNHIDEVIDTYEKSLFELFLIRNPYLRRASEFKKRLEFKKFKKNIRVLDNWVYYPWLNRVVRVFERNTFHELRTARNRNLINITEQEKFRRFVVGIVGLSVGNSIALTLSYSGGAETMRLADSDNLEITNLNRIRASIGDIGLNKTYVTAKQVYEINPYANLSLYPDGLHDRNIEEFVAGPPKLDVLVDAVDNLRVKVMLRSLARKHKIPVIMGTDNGENIILDIERYDKDKNLAYFHDRLTETEVEEILKKPLSFPRMVELISKIVDLTLVPKRMTQSLALVGSRLYSWPQLGTAAFLCGVAVTYAIRKLSIGQELPTRRVLISLDKLILGKEDLTDANLIRLLFKNS